MTLPSRFNHLSICFNLTEPQGYYLSQWNHILSSYYLVRSSQQNNIYLLFAPFLYLYYTINSYLGHLCWAIVYGLYINGNAQIISFVNLRVVRNFIKAAKSTTKVCQIATEATYPIKKGVAFHDSHNLL